MKKNIAIILGITDYLEISRHLPACQKDVEILDKVLRFGGHFNEIIVIPSADAQALKANLAETIQRFQHEEVQDLFFYFSGHGEFRGEEFIYLLRDYSEQRSAATSLSNSELDGMLKSISPTLTVKVVDACYSGMQYIKGASSFDDYIKNSNTFSNCYFLFSSQSDQKSYANENISDFTYEFAKSIASSKSDSVRYKDIIDSISDAFAVDSKQQPLFISQANYTEVFGNFPLSAREQIDGFIDQADKNNITPADLNIAPTVEFTASAAPSLLELVEADSQRYVTLDKAKSLVIALQTRLELSPPPSELDGIYEINSTWFENYDFLPNPRALGEWVKSNKDQEYFATPAMGTETYESPPDIMTFLKQNGTGPKTVTKTRPVIIGLESSVEGLPFLAYRLTLKPKHPNLIQYGAWFTFVISKTRIQIFLSFVEYNEISWDKYSPGQTTQWERHEFDLASRNSAQYIVETFYKNFIEWTTERVKARLEKNKTRN